MAAAGSSGGVPSGNGNESGLDPDEARDLLRHAVVGILSEADPADPTSRAYRRKLAAALG